MTAIPHTSKTAAAPVAQGLIALAGVVVRRLREFMRAAKHRHDAAMLAGLDDRMLADIGLTRGDVRDAFSEPVWRDPTDLLVSRAHERRINRRRLNIGLDEKSFDAPSIVPSAAVHGSPVGARYY